jgi:hypothetical protein
VDSKIKQVLPKIDLKIGRSDRKDSKPFSYYDLIDVLEHPGCPVCNLLVQKSDRYLDSIFSEMLLNPETQQAFRERRGLCALHSARATEYIGGSLEIAMLYTVGLEEVVNAFMADSPNGNGGWLQNFTARSQSALENHLAPSGACAVCSYMVECEQRYIETLGKYISDRKLEKAFEASEGLCLPHFRIALREINEDPARDLLVTLQKSIWTELKRDLDSFIAKSNYLHQHEINPREGESWRRVMRIAGKSGVFGPDRF